MDEFLGNSEQHLASNDHVSFNLARWERYVGLHLLSWTVCDEMILFSRRFLFLQSFPSSFLFARVPWQQESQAKDSLTDSGCLHDRAQAMVIQPCRSSTIISSPVLQSSSTIEFYSRVLQSQVQFYSLPVEVESALAGGGRWHAAVGTVGGNCFPGICQPRVTLAICSPPNALHLLSDIFTLAIC